MNESKYILTIYLDKFKPIEKTPIESLLVSQEEIELYLSGKNGEFWITNKRIVVYHFKTIHILGGA